MKIEKQVCTFLQAKKLKELGVKCDTFFSWFEAAELDSEGSKIIKWHPVLMREDPKEDYVALHYSVATLGTDNDFYETRGGYSAFTVAELGVMLGYGTTCSKGKNEAEHRANCLIQDLENFVYTVASVNDRLMNNN